MALWKSAALLLLSSECLANKVCRVVEDCGCPSDGVSSGTTCLRRCIRECHQASPAGATLVFKKGRYVTGALNLTSFLTLHLDQDAEILGSLDPLEYPVVPALPGYGTTRDVGGPAENHGVRHQALISGWNITGTSITGHGRIDGRGAVTGPDGLVWYMRRTYGRPRLIEPMFCKDFKIEDVKLHNSPFWTLHPYACDGVTIRGLSITAHSNVTWGGVASPNSDGIDPDSSSNVLVENCFVDVGDDTVAIKSGMDFAGRKFGRPSKNMVFRNCHFVQNAMSIGSEESGGVQNITFENITMGPRHHPYTDGPLIHLKAQRGRGGYIKDITFKNITMLGPTAQAIIVAMHYGSPEPAPTNKTATPVFENIVFDGIQVDDADNAGAFAGLPEQHVKNITMKNVIVARSNSTWSCENVDNFAATNVKPAHPCGKAADLPQVWV